MKRIKNTQETHSGNWDKRCDDCGKLIERGSKFVRLEQEGNNSWEALDISLHHACAKDLGGDLVTGIAR